MSEDERLQVLYITGFVTDTLKEAYGMSFYSHAGTHKKRNIVRSLQSNGVAVEVLSPVLFSDGSPRWFGSRTITDEETGINLRLPITTNVHGVNFVLLTLTTAVAALRMVVQEDFDAIIFYNFRAKHTIPAVLCRVLFRTPVLLEYEDGVFLHENPIVRWMGKLLRRVTVPFVDGAFCANSRLAELAPTENTVVVRGFPSVGMPEKLPEPERESPNPVVMFAGRFDTIRGIDPYLEMIPSIEGENVEFWISGYGPDEQLNRVEGAVERLDDERVRFFGTLPWEEYRRKIVQADVLVNLQDPDHPISTYTFPSKLLDFMSAGGLVVSTDMSDLRATFDDLMLFVRNDKPAADAVQRALVTVDEDEAGSYTESAERWIRNRCNHERVGADIQSVIDVAR